MKKGNAAKPAFFCLFVALWLLLFPGELLAETIGMPAAFTGEDEENGYRYECAGIGGFSSSVQAGETAAAVVITADEGLSWSLYRNGVATEYENGELIFEEGEYEYELYRADDRDSLRGNFSFSVENFELGEESGAYFFLEEKPDMEISLEDKERGYRYTFPNGASFLMSIPAGAAGTDPVTLEFSGDVAVYQVLVDGKRKVTAEPFVYEDPGTYQITCMSASGDEGTGSSIYQLEISFVILPDQVRGRDFLFAPMDFQTVSVYCNGRRTESARDYLQVKEDGLYRIEYCAAADPSIRYTLEFFSDNTAPKLIFSKNIYGERVTTPISFSCEEKDCTVSVYQNGIETAVVSGVVEEGGQYRILAEDLAGNQRSYQFTAIYGGGMLHGKEILALGAVGIGILVWLFRLRRNMGVL